MPTHITPDPSLDTPFLDFFNDNGFLEERELAKTNLPADENNGEGEANISEGDNDEDIPDNPTSCTAEGRLQRLNHAAPTSGTVQESRMESPVCPRFRGVEKPE